MELSKSILKVRKAHKLNQEQLAEILNVSRQTISNWENDKSYPDLIMLITISDHFQISLDELLKGDRKMLETMNRRTKINKYLKWTVCLLFILIVTWTSIYFVDRSKEKEQLQREEKQYQTIVSNLQTLGFQMNDLHFDFIVENEVTYQIYRDKESLLNKPLISAMTKWEGPGSMQLNYDGSQVVVHYLEEKQTIYCDKKGNLVNSKQSAMLTESYEKYQEKTRTIAQRMVSLYEEVFN